MYYIYLIHTHTHIYIYIYLTCTLCWTYRFQCNFDIEKQQCIDYSIDTENSLKVYSTFKWKIYRATVLWMPAKDMRHFIFCPHKEEYIIQRQSIVFAMIPGAPVSTGWCDKIQVTRSYWVHSVKRGTLNLENTGQ